MPGTAPPLCVSHLGRAGRKTTLDERVAERLVAMLTAGSHVHTALGAVGVPRATFYDWLDRGNPARNDVRGAPFREFRRRIERARAEGEARNITIIAASARRDWRAAAWLLERQAPERWGRHSAGTDRETAALADDELDPLAALPGDELAARRRARR